MTRVARLLAVALIALSFVACGSTTGSGYTNPTSGDLPRFGSSHDVVAAAGGDCEWRYTTTSRGDQLASCDRDGLVLMILGPSEDPMTIEKIQQSEASPEDLCLWWGFMRLAYFVSVTQLRQAASSGSPSGDSAGSATPIPEATALLVGSNWVLYGLTAGPVTSVAARTGGYLVDTSGCRTGSATPS